MWLVVGGAAGAGAAGGAGAAAAAATAGLAVLERLGGLYDRGLICGHGLCGSGYFVIGVLLKTKHLMKYINTIHYIFSY